MPEARVFPYANMSATYFREATAPTKLLSFISLDFRPSHALVGRWTRPLNRKCQHYSGFCSLSRKIDYGSTVQATENI